MSHADVLMLPYRIWHKIKNHPVVFTIPCLREGVTNVICVEVFSTTTTFPLMFLKKNKEVKKLVFNEVQIRELFNTGQRNSADHSECQYSCSQNRSRHSIRTLDSKG